MSKEATNALSTTVIALFALPLYMQSTENWRKASNPLNFSFSHRHEE